jgi:malonate decarboxylase alpha subunit
VVVVQVNDIVDELPHVDIPASWVDVIVAADRPHQMDAEGNFSTVTCGGSAA